jgi:pyruvate formate lyase activating enzyme
VVSVFKPSKVTCAICGKVGNNISSYLKVCAECIKSGSQKAVRLTRQAHSEARVGFGLSPEPLRNSQGVKCGICGNECRIGLGEKGYCGLSENVGGKIVRNIGTVEKGLISYYSDPHPTNCVPSWVCAGGTGAGYPKYAKKDGPEYGFANAALFLGTCSYHCLYCQNTSWHRMIKENREVTGSFNLMDWMLSNGRFTCMCWFGGSPEPQMPFVYGVSKEVREETKKEGRVFRICLEANGNFAWPWLRKIAEICLKSGGGIKFDLKAWDEKLNQALSGISNKQVFSNFEKLAVYHNKRKEPAFLRASTLLVPGYIDEKEIAHISRFIAELDPTIPYSLLAFSPRYKFSDLSYTSKEFALKCEKIARDAGLKRVRIGNRHLLR